jgi:hypothetical protein
MIDKKVLLILIEEIYNTALWLERTVEIGIEIDNKR